MTGRTIDQKYIDSYQQEGAVLIPGVFTDWVDHLRGAHDRLEKELRAVAEPMPGGSIRATLGGTDELPPMNYSSSADGGFSIRNAAFHDADFIKWRDESPAAAVVGQVCQSKHVQFWFDLSFGKRGNQTEGATPWHTDIGSFSFVGDQLPSFWIALTDVPANNAPMITVVGSHRDKRHFRPVFGRENTALTENYAELSEMEKVANAPATEKRVWAAKAGDVVLIHPYCYHASLPRTDEAGMRLGYSSRWLGDDVTWQKREMTFDYPDDPRFANIELGKPAPTETFPIMWEQ